VIAGTWIWLGEPVPRARAPLDPAQKLECVSYTPFRGAQSPLDPSLHVPVQQIAQDLAQLAKITNCVRTYSVDSGLDQVPGEAAKVGLKVIQGIWLGSNRFRNSLQIDTAVALAKRYPGTIEALVVGNEVLLRGEMTAADLVATIRYVKSRAEKTPVTYADVWEFWLRNREIYNAVDFVTIHILPYWEDFPVRAKYAASHVDQIRKRVAVAFPNKEILIGETGWPSAGRMRDGALPSLANQAFVVSQILALAKAEKFRVNLIEAYDQPWKRQLEGTVGGYWGLFRTKPGSRNMCRASRSPTIRCGSGRWAAGSLSACWSIWWRLRHCGAGPGGHAGRHGCSWRSAPRSAACWRAGAWKKSRSRVSGSAAGPPTARCLARRF